MTIPDDQYFRLVKTLTDQHEGSDYFAVMGRAWVENQIQVALCAADVFPESSEDGAASPGARPSGLLVADGMLRFVRL